MIIAVDFDGTIVKHEFPRVGMPVPGAVQFLKLFTQGGAKLILYTMRSGGYLEDAVRYLRDREVKLFGVNENPEQKSWTSSPKAYAHIYIDDAAYGCPLLPGEDGGRDYVDWSKVGPAILKMMDEKIPPVLDLSPEAVAKSLDGTEEQARG